MAKNCKHKDCRYYNEKPAHNFSCNYALITGKTKLSQLKSGEKYDVNNCQFYSTGRKVRPSEVYPLIDIVSEEIQREANILSREPNAVTLYDLPMDDKDLARVYGVSYQSVAHWRKIKGLGHLQNAVPINWEEIDSLLEEGYSDIATAKLTGTKAVVVQEYRKTKSKEGDKD